MKTASTFAAKPGHPLDLWVVFFRKTPKAAPELMFVSAGIFNAMVFVGSIAKEKRVPQKKFEICHYVPFSEVRSSLATAPKAPESGPK